MAQSLFLPASDSCTGGIKRRHVEVNHHTGPWIGRGPCESSMSPLVTEGVGGSAAGKAPHAPLPPAC